MSHPKFSYSDFEPVKNIALGFPGAEESTSHEGTPSIKVRGKLMTRLHESGEFIPIRIDFEHHDHFLEQYPEVFHIPEHFKGYPYICMWTGKANKKLLTEVLEISWKGLAGKAQLKEWTLNKSK